MGTLHGWFKPKVRLTTEGAQWISDGRIAIAWEADPTLRDHGKDSLRGYIQDARVDVTEAPRDNGYITMGASHFQAHYIDLVEAAHPGVSWRVGPGNLDAAVAYISNVPVAVVMCLRWENADEVCKGPDCPECNGRGGPECETCMGCGENECPTCGHEDMCEDCDGRGHTGGCAACGGSGRWKAPAP